MDWVRTQAFNQRPLGRLPARVIPVPGPDAVDSSNARTRAGVSLGSVSRDAPVIPIVPPPRAASDLASRSDDELMTLAATGMLAAFGEIVRRYERQVRSLCRKVLGGDAPGDDLAQDVFLEIWRTCARYEGRGQFRSFLFTTTHNRCLNTTRRRLPTVPLETAVEAHAAIGAAPDQIELLLAAERRQSMDRRRTAVSVSGWGAGQAT